MQTLALEGGAGAVAEAVIGNIEQLFQSSQFDQMQQAAMAIARSARVFIAGMGCSCVFAFNFWSLGRMMLPRFNLVPRQAGLLMGCVTDPVGQNLLLIMIIQIYSIEIIDIIDII